MHISVDKVFKFVRILNFNEETKYIFLSNIPLVVKSYTNRGTVESKSVC